MRSLLPLALLVVSAGLIQAESTGLGIPDFGNLTSSAILGWYAWHTATRTIPSLVSQFRQELALCRAGQRAEAEAFRNELAAQRAARHADQQLTMKILGQIRDCLTLTKSPRPPSHGGTDEEE